MFLNTDKKIKHVIIIQIVVSCYKNIKQQKYLQNEHFGHFFRIHFLMNCTFPQYTFSPQGFLGYRKWFKLKPRAEPPKYTTEFMLSSHLPLQLWSTSIPVYKCSWWGDKTVECFSTSASPTFWGRVQYHHTLASLSAGRKIREVIKVEQPESENQNQKMFSAYLLK